MTIDTKTSLFGRTSAWRGRTAALAIAAVCGLPAVATMSGCTSRQVNDGTSPAYLIVNSLQAASGADPQKFGSQLQSDVITLIKTTDAQGNSVVVPTVFIDGGEMNLALALKDPGAASSPNSPTSANFITVSRYHVQFVRADGRNVEGVDVPFSFDGAATGTVSSSTTLVPFTLVRAQAKTEAPLKALGGKGAASIISTIANVTFYGTDQAGRSVSVTASISVDFGDFADPNS